MAQIGGSCADFVGNIHVQLHARLMGNGRKVKHAVGGASQRHIHGQGVHKCFFCHDIPWADVFLVHLHHLHAGMFRQLDALGVNSRDGAVSLKSHTQDLGQAVHAVSRIHAGTGTAGRTCLILKLLYILLGHVACRVSAHRLKHAGKAGFMPLHMAGQHGTAADKHGGHIDPGCRHQKSRNILITVRHHYQRVKLMGQRHTLCGIRNQIPGHQGILHADMPHGNTIADSNGREHHRSTAGHGNAQLHGIHNLIQVHMARNYLIIGTYNTHQRLSHLFLCHTKSIKQGPVGCLLHTCLNRITFHVVSPFI